MRGSITSCCRCSVSFRQVKQKKKNKNSKLNAADNHLGDEAAPAVAELIRTAMGLESLHIAKNDFTVKGLRPICDAVAASEKLRLFYMHDNDLSDEGDAVQMLIWLLSRNNVLQSLDVGNCQLSADGIREIVECMGSKNYTLTSELTQRATNQSQLEHSFFAAFYYYGVNDRGKYDLPQELHELVTAAHARNYAIQKEVDWRTVRALLYRFCAGLMGLELPIYVMLFIFDWMPFMHFVPEWRKVECLRCYKRSFDKVYAKKNRAPREEWVGRQYGDPFYPPEEEEEEEEEVEGDAESRKMFCKKLHFSLFHCFGLDTTGDDLTETSTDSDHTDDESSDQEAEKSINIFRFFWF